MGVGIGIVLGTASLVLLLAAWWRHRIGATALAALDLHAVCQVADEDLRRLDDALDRLELESMGAPFDDATRREHRRATAARDRARLLLGEARRCEDVAAVTRAIEASRYAVACALARSLGASPPSHRPPCMFNPAHGPATTDITWSLAGDAEREIPVCARDAVRVAAGGVPDLRVVRDGHRLVPWFRADRLYAPYVEGYWGSSARRGAIPADLLTTMMGERWELPGASGSADWSRRPDDEERFVQRWNDGTWSSRDLGVTF